MKMNKISPYVFPGILCSGNKSTNIGDRKECRKRIYHVKKFANAKKFLELVIDKLAPDVLKKTRSYPTSIYRSVLMYILREEFNIKYEDLAVLLCRDHSNISANNKRVKFLIEHKDKLCIEKYCELLALKSNIK